MNTRTDSPTPHSPVSPVLFDSGALDSALAQGQAPLGIFRAALKSAAATLQQQFLDGADAAALVLARSHTIDALVTRAWRHFMTGPDQGIALVAVGGYGRSELLPGSDVDLMILLDDADHEPWRGAIESFLTLLWDIGLEVGHSVRDIAQCIDEAQRDITVATNLMEYRLLIGHAALSEKMRETSGPARVWTRGQSYTAK